MLNSFSIVLIIIKEYNDFLQFFLKSVEKCSVLVTSSLRGTLTRQHIKPSHRPSYQFQRRHVITSWSRRRKLKSLAAVAVAVAIALCPSFEFKKNVNVYILHSLSSLSPKATSNIFFPLLTYHPAITPLPPYICFPPRLLSNHSSPSFQSFQTNGGRTLQMDHVLDAMRENGEASHC